MLSKYWALLFVLFKYCLFCPMYYDPMYYVVMLPISQMSKPKPREAEQFSKVIWLLSNIQSLAWHAQIFNFMTRQHRR